MLSYIHLLFKQNLIFLIFIFLTACLNSETTVKDESSLSNKVTSDQLGFEGGDGTVKNPYKVKTAEQLFLVRNNLSAHYMQVADIDLNIPAYNSGIGWTPIGSIETPFVGSYNGGGFTISNLIINRPLEKHNGLFGFLVGARIENLRLTKVLIWGGYKVGAISGSAFKGTEIRRVIVDDAHLKVEERYAGGILGSGDDVLIYQCAFQGSIEKGFYEDWNFIGGLSGSITSSTTNKGSFIIESFADVTISSNTHNSLGGLVGAMWFNATIENCYSKGKMIISGDYAGGIVGELRLGAKPKRIVNTYTTMRILAKTQNKEIHAFVGRNEGGIFKGNFYEIGKLNYRYSDTLVNAKNVAQMKIQTTFEAQGWDFDNIWAIDPNGKINDGYPYLKWFLDGTQ
jgi:hypothetical protein